MKRLALPFLGFAISISSAALARNPYDPSNLDPAKDKERERLLKMVSEPTGGYHHSAAQRLAKAGYEKVLLGILAETENIGTMQAVAAATGAESIPVFRELLQEEPDNVHLVRATSFVRSPEIAPVLLKIVRHHPEDAGDARQRDVLGYAIHSLRSNLCQSALEEIQKRFENCDKNAVNRKAHYALTLFWLGDTRGVDFMVEQLETDLRESKLSGESWLIQQLATHFWLDRLKKNPHLPDLESLEPMLPVLVRGATTADRLFLSDWGKVFSALTFHPYPTEEWKQWLDNRKAIPHPVYSQALDQVVAKAVAGFERGMEEAGKKSATIADMRAQRTLRPPENMRHFVYEHLFHFNSNSKYAPDGIQRSEEKAAELDLQFYIGHSGRLLDKAPPLFRKDFNELNITVLLITSNEDPAVQQQLIAQARKACGPFEEYIKGRAKSVDNPPVKRVFGSENRKIEPEEKKSKAVRQNLQPGNSSAKGRASVKVKGEFIVAPFKVGAAVSGANSRYRWTEIPAPFGEDEFSFTQFDFKHEGVTEFEVRSDGKIYLAVTSRWGGGGGGNGSSNWKRELIPKDEFLAEGWKEVAKLGETGDEAHGHNWVIYERECRKGERFRLRTEKYCAPILFF